MTTARQKISPELDESYKWKAFAAIALSFFTVVMTMSMVFVVLSSIADDFEVTLRAVSWVVISEALVVTALLLPMGRLADTVGRKKVHLVGLAIFGAGALFTALAPVFWTLIAARVVMALGNAMVQSVGTAMVVSVFPAAERGKAIGSQTTAVSVGGASGPIIAGLMLEVVSWQVLFLMLLVPVTIAFVAAYIILDETSVGEGKGDLSNGFDWGGSILSGLSVVILVLTINNPFGVSWGSPLILGGLFAVVVLLVWFVRWELARTLPMLELRLFKIPAFRLATMTRLLGFMGSSTNRFLLALFLISLRGMSEGAAGLVLFLFSFGMAVAAQTAGRLTDKVGPRPFAVMGLGGLAISGLLFAFMTTSTSTWFVSVVVLFAGVTNGVWNVPNNSTILGAVPPSELGVVGAFTNLTRNMGNVFGQAIASTVVVAVMVSQGFDIPLSDVGETVGAGAAFTDGWKYAHLAVAGYALIAMVLAAFTNPEPGAS